MQIRKLASLAVAERQKILTRVGGKAPARLKKAVVTILASVRKNGKREVIRLTNKHTGANLRSLEVTDAELRKVQTSKFSFLRQATSNITRFHKLQIENIKAEKKILIKKGIEVWREWRPIERVGIYAPGGLATYPSSVLMQAIPAQLAGCEEIILATPPSANGKIPEVVLAAAKLSGVTKIIKTGGAQAIAALYYIYNCEKITGPGNTWVTEAKQQLSSKVAIDMPAGPSEVLVLTDGSANPTWVAADLLSQAEHAATSSLILVTTSKKIADKVVAEIDRQKKQLERQIIVKASLERNCWILIAKNLQEAIEFTNEYAPEHLEIMTKDDTAVLKKIVNAGSVFLGPYSCEPAGDYATGSNHVLPTAGFARNFSALSVESFGKKIQVQKVSKKGLSTIRETCEKFGEVEGLDAHAKSISIRFQK